LPSTPGSRRRSTIDAARRADIPNGAVYAVPIASSQSAACTTVLGAAQWNDCEISVAGETYTIILNGFQTANFTNNGRPGRLPARPAPGFIGRRAIQSRLVRAVRIRNR
jgi:hypothetical protein